MDGIRFILNGTPVVARGYPVFTTLLDYVRAEGLTGSKEGCAEGECGACTVAVVKGGNSGTRFVPVNSCLMLLSMAAGLEIYTVEALARDGQLTAAQQALVDYGGSQCGYCTPGFAVSLFSEQYRPDRTGVCDPHSLSGNLCRCTGYRPIRDAALSLGAAPAGPFRDRLALPAVPRTSVAYEHLGATFLRPSTLAECLDLMAANPQARIVAGGTDVAVEYNLRYRREAMLISIESLPELCSFYDGADAVILGAGLTLTEIADQWTHAPAAFRDWLVLFASPLIRNRATLGGNLATASPIGDAAPLLIAMDAQVNLASAKGKRSVPLDSFFQSYRVTALAEQELIVSVEIPKPLNDNLRFYKVAKRRSDDISTVAAGLNVGLDRAGRVEHVRFAFGGVAATPIRTTEAEESILGRAWNLPTIKRAQDVLSRTLRPISDHRGSAAYRLALAQTLLEKYWHECAREAAA